MRSMVRKGIGVASRALTVYLGRIARGADLRVITAVPDLEGQSCRSFAARLLRDASAGHVIVPFWSAHQLTIALLAAERFGLRPALGTFEVVADDSPGGELMRRVGEGLDLAMRRIHTRADPERLRDLGAWMRSPRPFFIAVDGGSTYRTVPTGIVRLAARLGSVLWPLAIRARPLLRVPGVVAEIPLPRTSLTLAIGAPFTVGRRVPVAAAAEELRLRLQDATAAADALIAGRIEATAAWAGGGA